MQYSYDPVRSGKRRKAPPTDFVTLNRALHAKDLERRRKKHERMADPRYQEMRKKQILGQQQSINTQRNSKALTCSLCEVILNPKDVKPHLLGNRHRKNVNTKAKGQYIYIHEKTIKYRVQPVAIPMSANPVIPQRKPLEMINAPQNKNQQKKKRGILSYDAIKHIIAGDTSTPQSVTQMPALEVVHEGSDDDNAVHKPHCSEMAQRDCDQNGIKSILQKHNIGLDVNYWQETPSNDLPRSYGVVKAEDDAADPAPKPRKRTLSEMLYGEFRDKTVPAHPPQKKQKLNDIDLT